MNKLEESVKFNEEDLADLKTTFFSKKYPDKLYVNGKFVPLDESVYEWRVCFMFLFVFVIARKLFLFLSDKTYILFRLGIDFFFIPPRTYYEDSNGWKINFNLTKCKGPL